MTTDSNAPRIVFAGDRQIAVDVLTFLLSRGVTPLGLMLPDRDEASHADELLALCKGITAPDLVWYGKAFRSPQAVEKLRALDLDYILCIHFPLIVPQSVLNVPKEGVLNLHPAYLPYNRGWHTSIWALLDKTPFGATLHFMSEQLDMGDIVHQKELAVNPEDTGDTLYKRAMRLEVEVFKEAWPRLVNHSFGRKPQSENSGTRHDCRDLFRPEIQEIDLDEATRAGDLIDKMRALTTSRLEEASYFVVGGRRYRVQINITPESRCISVVAAGSPARAISKRVKKE
jgi:methionyl-tRNA formyltransferase